MSDLIAEFEAAAIPYERWHHREHLSVALHYLQVCPGEATERMRTGILRLNAALGIAQTPTGGYHESITIFWVTLLRARLAACGDPEQVLAECCQDRLILEYYSRERIMSWEARTGWVEPDLKPIE